MQFPDAICLEGLPIPIRLAEIDGQRQAQSFCFADARTTGKLLPPA
jgi:hypothetical protein